MSSVRVGVNIGDIFDLSNGEKVKLRVQVSNFIYPPQKSSAMPVKAVNYKTLQKWNNTEKADDVPTITTVYVYYMGWLNESVSGDSKNETKRDGTGRVGVAKAANDKNEYSIKICYGDKEEDAKWEDAGNIAEKDGLKNMKSFLGNENGGLAKKILLSTDKGKTSFRTITLVNGTPKIEDLKKYAKDGNKEELKKLGYTMTESDDEYILTPDESATVIGETDEPSKVILRDTVYVSKYGEDGGDIDISISSADNTPVTLENKDATPVAVAEAPAEHEHAWDDGVVTVAATCTEVGVMTHTCECGETMTKEIPALGHVFDENGVCTVCGASAAPVEEPKEEPENEEPKAEEPKEEEPKEEEPKADTPVTQPTVDPNQIVVETPVQPAPTTEPASETDPAE